MDYKLRFDVGEVEALAQSYLSKTLDAQEEHIEKAIGPAVRERGWYTKDEFLQVCKWKTARSRSRCASNDEQVIVEATRLALKAESERLRIGILTLLRGVSWPTASVLVHFGHPERYPILDYRALSSLSIPEPDSDYTFPFWWDYVQICRELASKCAVSMRTLDRALWQYSKDKDG